MNFDFDTVIDRNATHRPTLVRPINPAPSVEPEPDHDPEVTLWTALLHAGPDGMSIAALMDTTGKGRTWVYTRLQQYAEAGRAAQVRRGRWAALDPPPNLG